MNTAAILGRFAADPELKHTSSGVAVTSFTLAVDRNYAKPGQERQTDWIDVVAWRGTAEFICKYFAKGRMIAVSGFLQTRTWEDKQGSRRKATELVAREVHFCGELHPRQDVANRFPQGQDSDTSAESSLPSTAGQEPRKAAPHESPSRDFAQASLEEDMDFLEDSDLPF